MSDYKESMPSGHGDSPESNNSNSREVLMALFKFGGLMALLAIVGFLLLKVL